MLSNDIKDKQSFCIIKSQFVNFKKNKTEKFVIFSLVFQLNMFSEINELFFDGTFKICPKNFYQLVNVFGFIEKKNFYMPLAYILMSSKTFELYDEVLLQLKRFIEKYSGFKNFQEIKVMCDFEIPLRKAIKANFPGCILIGC